MLLLAAACVAPPIELDSDDSDSAATTDSAGTDTEDTDETGETADTDTVDTDTGDTDTGDTDIEESWPKACPALYDEDIVPTFELQFSRAELESLYSDCAAGSQEYHPVSFTYDGETVAAMARLKGNWSWSCEKLQFVVSFNEEDPSGRFHGQRKLMLDAPWYDRTLMHERLAFPLFQERGLPYSCVNNAKLYVNGEYQGLYANVERIDKEYLERHFEEDDGNLYQGGTELKTNEDVNDTSNLVALQAATSVDEIAALMDLDQAVAEWSMEAMLPAMDNYWAGVEINYYLYDHPTRGFVYLPYDLDISFGDARYTTGELVWGNVASSDPITYEHPGWQKEALVERVLSDTHWCDRFVEELILSRAVYAPEVMEARLDEWEAQIADAVAEDPNKIGSMADHQAAVAELRAFFAERAAYVDGWLAVGGHCPARF
jgi:hypothetical protein